MRRSVVKSMAAILMAAAMSVPGCMAFAEEAAPETAAPATEAVVSETEAPAPQTEAPTTEAAAPETEAPATEESIPETAAPETEAATEVLTTETEAPETEAVTEAPATEGQTEAAKAENEKKEEYKTNFRFENEEVIITAKVNKSQKLPKNTEIRAEKLAAGSEKYEAAKNATMSSLGTDSEAVYSFYEVTFMADGKEVNVADEAVTVQVMFKNAEKSVHVKNGTAKDITEKTFTA